MKLTNTQSIVINAATGVATGAIVETKGTASLDKPRISVTASHQHIIAINGRAVAIHARIAVANGHTGQAVSAGRSHADPA